jgi:hypothetical protein
MKYWIIVASKNHCLKSMENNFIQACHGKIWPLKKMQPNDKFILYSPKLVFGEKAPCQKFINIGKITEELPYEIQIPNGDRRNVVFEEKLKTISILPLIENLDFITNKKKLVL